MDLSSHLSRYCLWPPVQPPERSCNLCYQLTPQSPERCQSRCGCSALPCYHQPLERPEPVSIMFLFGSVSFYYIYRTDSCCQSYVPKTKTTSYLPRMLVNTLSKNPTFWQVFLWKRPQGRERERETQYNLADL